MKFKWANRYSNTEKPDKQGRWARLCYCNGFLIATITCHGEQYIVNYHFPAQVGSQFGIERISKDIDYEIVESGVEQAFKTFIEQVTK